MLAPFLIMLREGVEAALIVGIIAAWMRQSGRGAWLPAIWAGVLLAIALSLFIGAALQLMRAGFPQRAQELFEAIVALIAVAVLTWMVFWMRSAARGIKGALHQSLDAAFSPSGRGTVLALVGVAFFAVAREGLESVFFLLAIFQQSPGPAAPLAALAGLAVSAVLGLAIYRGGVQLDLRRFFRLTGIVIILVAAGLFSGALRSLHEAGLWNLLQAPAFDLTRELPVTSLPGGILSALLGYHDNPAIGEVITWAAFVAVTLTMFLRPQPAPNRMQQA